MRWLRGLAILVVGLSAVQMGCGSDSFGGTGQGTLQLVRFGDGAEDQPDAVGPTGAQVDVCQSLCSGGGGGEIMVEPYTSTIVAAFVVNEGKSDIVIDSIQVSYPNAGLTDMNTAVAGGFVVPGRRCSDNATVRCADDFECNAACVSQETAIPFTMLDLDRKDLLGGDACATGLQPSLVATFVSIRGRDADGERYTINGGMNLEAANFDNCEDQ